MRAIAGASIETRGSLIQRRRTGLGVSVSSGKSAVQEKTGRFWLDLPFISSDSAEVGIPATEVGTSRGAHERDFFRPACRILVLRPNDSRSAFGSRTRCAIARPPNV